MPCQHLLFGEAAVPTTARWMAQPQTVAAASADNAIRKRIGAFAEPPYALKFPSSLLKAVGIRGPITVAVCGAMYRRWKLAGARACRRSGTVPAKICRITNALLHVRAAISRLYANLPIIGRFPFGLPSLLLLFSPSAGPVLHLLTEELLHHCCRICDRGRFLFCKAGYFFLGIIGNHRALDGACRQAQCDKPDREDLQDDHDVPQRCDAM
jgi:hypothetical protein